MLKSRKPVALIVLLWLLLLALPLGRANFCVQAWQTGVAFTPVSSSDSQNTDFGYDDDSDTTYRLAITTLPDPAPIARAYPVDREVQFGLAVASDDPRESGIYQAQPVGPDVKEIRDLDALIARHPADAALIAARLEASCAGLAMGRYDNPIWNQYWPKPFPILNQLRAASPARDWLPVLALAVRGGRLEPDNAFFDTVRIEALFAMHRDAEALVILRAASRKTTYDDHLREQDVAALTGFGRARALTPMEQDQLWNRVNSEYYFQLWDDCVAGHVIELRLRGQDSAAISIAVQLLRVGKLVREHAQRLWGSLEGSSVESEAIRYVYLPPLTGGRRGFVRLPAQGLPLNVTTNLAGYAQAKGRPEIAREVVAEWRVMRNWGKPAFFAALVNKTPGFALAEAANLQEHWGRLLLRTIPLCVVLLGLCEFAQVRFRLESRFAEGDRPLVARSRAGAMVGATVLSFLAIGDGLVAWHGSLDPSGGHPWPYSRLVAGLAVIMPSLVFGSVAGTFVLVSFARSRRWQLRKTHREPWLPLVKAALRSTDQLLALDWTPLVKVIAGTTMWSVLAFIYGNACMAQAPGPNEEGPFGAVVLGVVTVFPWFIFLAAALMRWNRLKERRRALAVTVLNLRELCRSYVIFALLLYPVTVFLIIPVDVRFNRIHADFVNVGQTATVLRSLGL